MKKISIAILMIFSTCTMASAELGVNIGVSGQMGVFEAKAEEQEAITDKQSKSAMAVFGYSSIFVEKTIGSRITVGLDYVPSALESETNTYHRGDTDSANAVTTKLQTVQVDFDNYMTWYVALNLTENFYIKGGISTVDVTTKEALATGSKYGNTELDGAMYGAGYNKSFDNGMFVRAEANVVAFDGVTLTSTTNTDNKVKLDELNGASAKISIGKSF